MILVFKRLEVSPRGAAPAGSAQARAEPPSWAGRIIPPRRRRPTGSGAPGDPRGQRAARGHSLRARLNPVAATRLAPDGPALSPHIRRASGRPLSATCVDQAPTPGRAGGAGHEAARPATRKQWPRVELCARSWRRPMFIRSPRAAAEIWFGFGLGLWLGLGLERTSLEMSSPFNGLPLVAGGGWLAIGRSS